VYDVADRKYIIKGYVRVRVKKVRRESVIVSNSRGAIDAIQHGVITLPK